MRYANTAAVLAAVCGTVVGASGAIINWNAAGSGACSNASNWNPAQVPGTNDEVVFGLTGTRTVTFDVGGVRSLAFRAGTVTTGGSGPSLFTTGVNVEVGQLAGDVATWNSRGAFDIGGSVILGRDAGSTGTLTRDGALLSQAALALGSATGDVIVGLRGTGTLGVGDGIVTLSDDVFVGFDVGSVGTVQVEGSSGTHPVFGDFILLGRIVSEGPNADMLVGGSGQGTLLITSGGFVDVSGAVAIGRSASGVGSASVVGTIGNLANPSRSRLSASRLDIGANTFAGAVGGTGSLTVSGGGRVIIDGPTTVGDPDGGGAASLVIGSAAVLETEDFIDRGNVTQLQSGSLVVHGDYLASAGTVFSIQGTGTVNLDGPAARLDASAPLGIDALRVGDATVVALSSTNGGVISVPSGDVHVGDSAGGDAEIRVSSGGSVNIRTLFLGLRGDGELKVLTGGTADVTNCFIGTGPGGRGRVTVSGAGAVLGVPFLTIGGNTSGGACRLVVSNGGSVEADVITSTAALGGVEVLSAGLLETLSPLSIGNELIVNGGTVRTPTLSLIAGASHQLAGRVEGLVRLAAPAVAAQVGNLDIVATGANPLINVGTLDIQGQLSVQGPTGWIIGDAVVQSTGAIVSGQTCLVSSTKTLTCEGLLNAPFTNLGTITCSGTTCMLASTLTSQTGTINGTRMELLPTGVLNAAGTVACMVVGQPGSSITALGTLSMGDGAAASGVDHRGLLTCGGNTVTLRTTDTALLGDTTMDAATLECRNSAGALRAIRLREELSGSGTVRASAMFNLDEGGQSVVSPHGLLTIEGSYSQLTSGALLGGVLLGEVETSERFDRLVVSGAARLGGTLSYRAAPGFVPTGREELTIVNAGEISGEFDTLDLPLGWEVEYTPTSVLLIAACPADFNADGGVDGDDVIGFFEFWDVGREEADFNDDGSVDGDDVIGFFGSWDNGC